MKIINSNIMFFLGVGALALALYASWENKISVASVSTIAFLAFMFFSFIDKISSFKAGFTGFEAQTRDVVKKAEGTIEELQLLGKEVIVILLSLMKRTGRMGGFSDNEEENIKNKMTEVLKRLEFSQQEIDGFYRESDIFKIDCFDYVSKILRLFRTSLDDNEYKKLPENDLQCPPSPESLSSFLCNVEKNKDTISLWVEDYSYYQENGKHRHPVNWQQRWETN